MRSDVEVSNLARFFFFDLDSKEATYVECELH
jgi:hypothetical protein